MTTPIILALSLASYLTAVVIVHRTGEPSDGLLIITTAAGLVFITAAILAVTLGVPAL